MQKYIHIYLSGSPNVDPNDATIIRISARLLNDDVMKSVHVPGEFHFRFLFSLEKSLCHMTLAIVCTKKSLWPRVKYNNLQIIANDSLVRGTR